MTFKKKPIIRENAFLILAVILLFGFAPGCYGNKNTNKVSNEKNDENDEFISRQEAAQPNIIVIVVDTLRADHLSTYGYTRNTDPNIAEFQKQAVVFSLAASAAPWTLPSYTSVLLGKQAYNHNMNIAANDLPNGALATSFMKGAGYKSVTIQTNELLIFLEAGRYFDETYLLTYESEIKFLDQVAMDKATLWLDSDANIANKFFLFIGLMSPHWPYQTNTGYLSEFVGDDLYNSTGHLVSNVDVTHTDGCWTYDTLPPDLQELAGQPQTETGCYSDGRLYIAGYDAEIKYADFQIGRLLQKLKDRGVYEESIIVITADHGENLVDHEVNFSHGDNLFQSLLHVPLLIKFPNQTSQKDIADSVRTIDIIPTIFDYAGIGYSGMDGKSLLPIINGETVNYDDRPVISYRMAVNFSGNEEVSVVKDGYKLIRNKLDQSERLYDLSNDFLERNDISSQHTETVSQLKDFLISAGSFTAW